MDPQQDPRRRRLWHILKNAGLTHRTMRASDGRFNNGYLAILNPDESATIYYSLDLSDGDLTRIGQATNGDTILVFRESFATDVKRPLGLWMSQGDAAHISRESILEHVACVIDSDREGRTVVIIGESDDAPPIFDHIPRTKAERTIYGMNHICRTLRDL